MLSRTLARLRGEHAHLADDVIAGKRFFWLGSGISRQLPDLVQLMGKALLFLRDRAIHGPEAADHRTALLGILDSHLPDERARYEADPQTWEPVDLKPLRNHYSEVLSAWVGDHPSDYLLIEGTDLPRTYGDPSIPPGAEHRLLAILIAEEVVTEVASGNWDGLIECAVTEMTGSANRLSVYVLPTDPRDAVCRSHLAKFHGCAVLALHDPHKYRKAIIATTAQVSTFSAHPGFGHMRILLAQNTQQFRSVILGLSVQDQDLLDIFTGAAASLPWPWDEQHPAYVFAEPSLSTSQRNVLHNSYQEFDAHRTMIVQRSAFGEFALPLLAALVVDVISRKLDAALRRQIAVAPHVADELKLGLDRLERLAVASVGTDYARLVEILTEFWSAFVRNYAGPQHFAPAARYVSIARGSLTDAETAPEVTVAGYDRLAAFMGIVGIGDLRGRWCARLVTRDGIPFVRLRGRRTKESVLLVIARSPAETDRFMATREWSAGFERMAIVHGTGRSTARRRSPASGIAAGRRVRHREAVYLDSIMQDVITADEIAERLATATGV